MIAFRVAAMAAVLALVPGLASAQTEALIVYKGATLIDGTGAPPKHVEAMLPTVVPDPVASAVPVPEARPEGVAN